MFESLDEKFDVEPTVPEATPESGLSPETLDDEQLSRQALRDVIEKGQVAVNEILNVATNTESARAYEVVAQMIKTVSDSAKDLLLLQKIKKDISGVKRLQGPKTQNNLFVGSTADLMKALKKNSLEVQPPPSE